MNPVRICVALLLSSESAVYHSTELLKFLPNPMETTFSLLAPSVVVPAPGAPVSAPSPDDAALPRNSPKNSYSLFGL